MKKVLLGLCPFLLATCAVTGAGPPPGATPPPTIPAPTSGATPPPSPTLTLLTTAGIQGLVLMGPMCPVIRPDQPCPDQPLQATIVVLDKAGRPVATLQSDPQGRFQVSLEPGTYTLVPEKPAGQPFPRPPAPLEVAVTAGRVVSVTITYDSGIR